MGEDLELAQRNEAVAKAEDAIKKSNMMAKLVMTEEWKYLIKEVYTDDWMLTQLDNMAVYTAEQRLAVSERMVGRSQLSRFCSDILEGGLVAQEQLDALAKLEAEELEQEQSGK